MTLVHVGRFVCALVAVSALYAVSRSGLLDLLDEMRGHPRRDR